MKPITNIASVQEASTGESKRLPAGGYICKYTNVEDIAEKQYLYMEFDIAEGEYKGYFKELEERADFWAGKCYRSYKEKALPMFKRMCSAVTKSNKGFIFDGNEHADESTLIGKKIGILLGEEEYIGNDGSVKTKLVVVREMPVDDIKAGKFKVPAIKKLVEEAEKPQTSDDGFMKIPLDADEETPFN